MLTFKNVNNLIWVLTFPQNSGGAINYGITKNFIQKRFSYQFFQTKETNMKFKKFVAHPLWATSRWLPRRLITRLMYPLSRISRPRFLVQAWLDYWTRAYDVKFDDVVIPPDGFRNFNDFHLRELKPGARSVDSSASIVFPCDALITDSGTIAKNLTLVLKGNRYTLKELISNNLTQYKFEENVLEDFSGGTYISFYLPLNSYHWWHSPMDGKIKTTLVHDGKFNTVSPDALRIVQLLLARNHRLIEFFYVDEKCDLLLVSVAAFLVGTIISTYDRAEMGLSHPNHHVSKGDKLGGFSFGSSIVMLTTKNYKPIRNFKDGEMCRQGEPFAQKISR